MSLLIQLVDSNYNKSPVLYIHNDEDEVMFFIENWLEEIKDISKNRIFSMFPLGRLEVGTAFADLIYKLGQYYIETMIKEVKEKDHVVSWLKVYNKEEYPENEVYQINLKS